MKYYDQIVKGVDQAAELREEAESAGLKTSFKPARGARRFSVLRLLGEEQTLIDFLEGIGVEDGGDQIQEGSPSSPVTITEAKLVHYEFELADVKNAVRGSGESYLKILAKNNAIRLTVHTGKNDGPNPKGGGLPYTYYRATATDPNHLKSFIRKYLVSSGREVFVEESGLNEARPPRRSGTISADDAAEILDEFMFGLEDARPSSKHSREILGVVKSRLGASSASKLSRAMNDLDEAVQVIEEVVIDLRYSDQQ